MTVYVDQLMNWGWKLRGREVRSCHMTADTDKELHAMARRIGMHTKWAQKMSDENQYRRHYDLVASRRQKAVEAGAVEINHREYAALIKAERTRLRDDASDGGMR